MSPTENPPIGCGLVIPYLSAGLKVSELKAKTSLAPVLLWSP